MVSTEKNIALIKRTKAFANTNAVWCDDYEKMISGMVYNPFVPELESARFRARRIVNQYNAYFPEDATQQSLTEDREIILRDLFGSVGARAVIEPPFNCDYGCNISLGHYFYSNFNLTILDGSIVTFGDRVMIGPSVTIAATSHPTEINARRRIVGSTFSKEVTIGNDVWIGGNCVIMPGIKIGSGVVVGANSVVTKDIPDFCIALGSPAKVIRKVDRVPDVPEAVMQALIMGDVSHAGMHALRKGDEAIMTRL